MKKIISVALLCLLVIVSKAQEKDPVLLTIGDKEVKLSEFNAIYHKNNSNNKSTKESKNEYLDLYVKFKLKVKEAEDLGYDTLPKFINELKGYRKQLAQPYLTDKKVTESLIKEAYERMKQDVRASHILIRIDDDADPKDTLLAYNKIIKIRNKILKGASFDEVVKEVSTKEYISKLTKELGYWNKPKESIIDAQDLGYFSALHMVYPFETAAYTTKVGDVSKPVRTKFGYHIVKVTDKRDAKGTIKVAHIMVKSSKQTSANSESTNKQKIDEIYEKLIKEGKDFAALAKQFSDDQGSARRGGELPEFTAGKMVEEFETASFALKNDGDISKPIKTNFGWHIIKRLSLKKLGSYDELYNSIKAKVARDSRSNKSKEALLKKIKKDNGFVENIKERNDFYKLITNEEFVKGTFKASKTSKYNKLMFGFYAKDGDKLEYTQIDFANLIEKRKTKGINVTKANLPSEINKIYNKILEEKAIQFKDSRLSKTNEEFRLLMQEYRDGILLFDLTDEKVWSKAVKDTIGLQQFYEQNKGKYMWEKRADAVIYSCSDETIAKNVEKILKKKSKKGYTNEDILKMVNVDSQLSLKIDEGKYSKGDNEDVDKATWEKGVRSSIKKEKGIVLVTINNILEPEPKKLSEIKGLITSDYQNYLEKEWVKDLKSKYKVEVNKEVLKLVK